MIVAVEGIDGAGKNTLVTELVRCLQEAGESVGTLAFPRYADSVHAKLAQRALYGHMGDLPDSVYGMATLFALDRSGAAEHLRDLSKQGVVIVDRYVASNAAYSAARLGGFPGEAAEDVVRWVYELEFATLELPRPDLSVYLSTPPEVAQERAEKRADADASRARDAYEKDGGLQVRTAAAYEELAHRSWAGRWLVSRDTDMIYSAITAR